MILIEQDAKRLLMERLDECLKVHADMLDAQNIGSIYELPVSYTHLTLPTT